MSSKAKTVFVVQDCVESGSGDDYNFNCDAQVSMSFGKAVSAAWCRFSENYAKAAGQPPSAEIKAEFDDLMSGEGGKCLYTIDATENTTVSVEILRREAV